jgi:DNA-binding IclR family transcriptional regulator
MKTVAKALTILDLFTETAPKWSVTEVASATGIDRATCYRMLKVLERRGYVSKDSAKKYELGATVLRLARTRERILPLTAILQAIVNDLAQTTEETAHASLIAGREIATVAVCDGLRPTRVAVDYAGKIELHATASGLACLAFGAEDLLREALEQPLTRYTGTTLTSASDIRSEIERIRRRGYSIADRSYDADVVGVAAPIMGPGNIAIGAVAVATPAWRMDADRLEQTAKAVTQAASKAAVAIGGPTPLPRSGPTLETR